MADKLEIYNGALSLLGGAQLATLSDNRPERLRLDAVWDNAVAYMLQRGMWNFALRTEQFNAAGDPPIPGWAYTHPQPSDYVRTVGISFEPTFRQGFEDYQDEHGCWYANVDTLYVKYISNDDDYGLNIDEWPQSFAVALEAYLAFRTGLPISGDKSNRNDLYQLFKTLLNEAKTLDAVNESVKSPPAGRLVRTRLAGLNRRDGQ